MLHRADDVWLYYWENLFSKFVRFFLLYLQLFFLSPPLDSISNLIQITTPFLNAIVCKCLLHLLSWWHRPLPFYQGRYVRSVPGDFFTSKDPPHKNIPTHYKKLPRLPREMKTTTLGSAVWLRLHMITYVFTEKLITQHGTRSGSLKKPLTYLIPVTNSSLKPLKKETNDDWYLLLSTGCKIPGLTTKLSPRSLRFSFTAPSSCTHPLVLPLRLSFCFFLLEMMRYSIVHSEIIFHVEQFFAPICIHVRKKVREKKKKKQKSNPQSFYHTKPQSHLIIQ